MPERLVAWLRTHAALLGLGALGFVVRAISILVARPACPGASSFAPGAGMPPAAPFNPPRCLAIVGDSLFNYMQGVGLANGKGWVNGFAYLDSGRAIPSAGKPPLFALYLAAVRVVGLRSVDQQRLGTALLGAVGVVLLGLLAWRLAGRRAGLIAGAVAALSPLLWINDGKLMVESLYVPLVAAVLLGAYRLWERPTPVRAVALGALIGLAALVRGEATQLLVLLVVPLVLALPRQSGNRRLTLVAGSFVTCLLVLFPWVVRNMATFEKPTLTQFGTGAVLLNGNCDAAYNDPEYLGFENFRCFTDDAEVAGWLNELIRPADRDESEIDALMRDKALSYIEGHAGKVPLLVLYREGRVWEVYRPGQNVEINYQFEDRGKIESILATAAYVVTMPLAIYGLVLLRRRRITIIPFVALALVVVVTVAFTFGITRFRVPVDAAAVVLAAIAADALWARFAGRGDPDGEPAADGGAEDDGRLRLAPPRSWLHRDRDAEARDAEARPEAVTAPG